MPTNCGRISDAESGRVSVRRMKPGLRAGHLGQVLTGREGPGTGREGPGAGHVGPCQLAFQVSAELSVSLNVSLLSA